MKMKMILIVLGLAMIKDQTSAATKKYLVESKGKHYLVETKGKIQVGRGGGGERPLGEKLPDGFEVKDNEGETFNLTGAIELHRLVLQDYDQLKKRKDEITRKIIDSTCAVDDEYDGHYKEITPLFLACWFGADKAATLLLSKGADPNKAAIDEDEVANTPLFQAASDGSIDLVKSLLASGADPNKGIRSTDGGGFVKTPLYKAASDGSIELVKSLLASGADPNKGLRGTHKGGSVMVKTPLYVAANYGNTEVVRSLLESKANPNEGERYTDKDGKKTMIRKNPLYAAAAGGNTEMVRILLASGARQDLDTGRSPLEAAKDEDSYKDEDDMEAKIEIVKLLEAAQSG